MKFSVAVICSTDHLIARCLASIPRDIPVIVVLNFPDEYVQRIVYADSRVTVYRHDERNLGLLRQLAAEHCETPAICYLDSDCIFCNGATDAIENELDSFYAVSIPMRYDYNNFATKIVAECRIFTTPDESLFMPFAFRLDIQDLIGKLFHPGLSWGEDSDQRKRISEAGVEFTISKGIVQHKPLTFKEDARSANRLGRGSYIQEKNGLSKPRHLSKDISVIHELKAARKCYKKAGIWAALYHFFVWRPAYKYGYWKARRKDEH